MTGKKRPRCEICSTLMLNLVIRRHKTQESKGFFCEYCNSIIVNNGIRVIKTPVFIGLKKVIK